MLLYTSLGWFGLCEIWVRLRVGRLLVITKKDTTGHSAIRVFRLGGVAATSSREILESNRLT